jgi:hypothetical protein
MKKKQSKRLAKEIIKQQVEEKKKLEPKAKQEYSATMDNVVIEIFWNEQEEGKAYEYPHLRGVKEVVVVAVGNMVTNKNLKVGSKVFIASFGHEIARDEVSAIAVIKGHEVLTIIK